MQFYKFVGFTVDPNWSEENDNRRVMRERVRNISMNSNNFNMRQRHKAFLFVTDATNDTVTVGIIVRTFCNVSELVSQYLKAIRIELKDTYLEEVTLGTICNMLGWASRNEYIDDNDEVLDKFELNRITGRIANSIEYGENIFDDSEKKYIYEESERFFARDTFIPELDRIYTGRAKNAAGGHPVHYRSFGGKAHGFKRGMKAGSLSFFLLAHEHMFAV